MFLYNRFVPHAELQGHSNFSFPEGAPQIEEFRETWRIDDEWWRQRPVNRVYYQLDLVDGRMVVVYEDVVQGRWYVQRYA